MIIYRLCDKLASVVKTSETESRQGALFNIMRPRRTAEQQKVEIAMYAVTLGATYTGAHEKRGHNNYYQLSKPGYEDRWIAMGNADVGKDPFSVPTIGEQEVEVREWAAKLGAAYKNECDNKLSYTRFRLSKPGYEDRLTGLGHLRGGCDPFRKASIGEQEIEVRSHIADDDSITYTGNYRKTGGTHYEFEFTKAGYENRWATLGNVRTSINLFGRLTIGEQEAEVRSIIANTDVTYTKGWWKPYGESSNIEFILSKPGYEDRSCALVDIRRGGFFLNLKLSEQVEALKKAIVRFGATYTGNNRHVRGKREFELSKLGYDNRWVNLACITTSHGGLSDPFSRATLGEQEREMRKHAARFQAVYTGVVEKDRRKSSNNRFELARPGFDNLFITLGHAKKAVDPFIGGGFDKSKPGCNYVLLVTKRNGEQCVKTGIAGRLPSRLSAHGTELKTAGAIYELLYKRHTADGAKVQDMETYLKRLFKPYRTCVEYAPGIELEGFSFNGGECFTLDTKEQLVSTLKNLSHNMGKI